MLQPLAELTEVLDALRSKGNCGELAVQLGGNWLGRWPAVSGPAFGVGASAVGRALLQVLGVREVLLQQLLHNCPPDQRQVCGMAACVSGEGSPASS